MLISTSYLAHLTYCTNVHPGESWRDVFPHLSCYLPRIKSRVSPEADLGVGLRLSAEAAADLQSGEALRDLQLWLHDNGFYVFTLNGFPYGRFHGSYVKEQAFSPDWRSAERLTYTIRLANLLAELLHTGLRGSISTVPISYRPWFGDAHALDAACREAACNLVALALHLRKLEAEQDAFIQLGLEPEPDGVIETAEDAVRYFDHYLVPAAGELLERQRLSRGQAEALVRRYIGICFDTCHASMRFESADQALSRLAAADIPVTKVQVSAALKLDWREADREAVLAKLMALRDPVYLHQVVEQKEDGTLSSHRDLTAAIVAGPGEGAREWRIHFHVPVFAPRYGALASTHDETAQALQLCVSKYPIDHLEIETYTWEVLPDELRTELVDSIAREFDWTRQQLRKE